MPKNKKQRLKHAKHSSNSASCHVYKYHKMHHLSKFGEDMTSNNLDIFIKGHLLQKPAPVTCPINLLQHLKGSDSSSGLFINIYMIFSSVLLKEVRLHSYSYR